MLSEPRASRHFVHMILALTFFATYLAIYEIAAFLYSETLEMFGQLEQ